MDVVRPHHETDELRELVREAVPLLSERELDALVDDVRRGRVLLARRPEAQGFDTPEAVDLRSLTADRG